MTIGLDEVLSHHNSSSFDYIDKPYNIFKKYWIGIETQ